MIRISSLLIFYLFLNIIVAVFGWYIKTFDASEVRYLISLPLLLVILVFTRYSADNKAILVFTLFFVLYLIIITLGISSDFTVSLSTALKYTFSILMLVVAVQFKKIEPIGFERFTIAVALLIYINLIIANIAGIGQQPYGRDSIFLGGGSVFQAYILVYNMLLVLLFAREKYKFLHYVINLLPILFIFRRGAILVAIVIGVLYFLTQFRTIRIRAFMIGLIIVTISYSLFTDQWVPVYEQRMEVSRTEIEERPGRWAEFRNINIILLNEELVPRLIGVEPFNYNLYAGVRRSLHTDFAVILFSYGYIGFFLYLIFNGFLFYRIYQTWGTKWFLLTATPFVFLSFSGQYYFFTALTMYYFIIGLMLNPRTRIILDEKTTELKQKKKYNPIRS